MCWFARPSSAARRTRFRSTSASGRPSPTGPTALTTRSSTSFRQALSSRMSSAWCFSSARRFLPRVGGVCQDHRRRRPLRPGAARPPARLPGGPTVLRHRRGGARPDKRGPRRDRAVAGPPLRRVRASTSPVVGRVLSLRGIDQPESREQKPHWRQRENCGLPQGRDTRPDAEVERSSAPGS